MISAQDLQRAWLAELTAAPGLPGREQPVADCLRRRLPPGWETHTDALGNLTALRPGAGPRVMLAAHMDEVGLIVRSITADGFLRVERLGGTSARALPGSRLTLWTETGRLAAAVGLPPAHLDGGKPLPLEELFIDIGARSAQEAAQWGVQEGDGLTWDGPLQALGGTRVQAKALDDVRADFGLREGLVGGKALLLPRALCVSKIDLLARQSYALPDGGDAVARFYEDLAKIDPSGEGMTLDVIEARSRVVAGLRDTIWPGWQIERAVDDLFGGRVMFFPLTPVGLDGRGESDLSLRTIAPFGLLEPLAWLLQMNGYPVLQ